MAHSTARITLEHARSTLDDVVAAVADIGCKVADAGVIGDDDSETTEIVIVDASRIGATVTLLRTPGSLWVGTWSRNSGPVANDPITAVFGEQLTGAALFAVLLLCGRGDLAAADEAASEIVARGMA